MNFKKVLTENPFVDEIVYATKILTANTVLKDQDEADLNETVATARRGDIYVACRNGKERFELLDFKREDMIKLGLTDRPSKAYPDGQINTILDNKYKMPKEIRDRAVQICKERVLSEYKEGNNYYRSLNGTPNIGDPGIYIDQSMITDPDMIIDVSRPLHRMSDSEINALDELGIIDNLIAQYPEKKYLRHLGGKRIDIVTARMAGKFDVLYVPSVDHEDIRQKFIDRVEQNKHYVLRCIYSEAMKIGSEEFYDKFMALFIVLEAAIEMLAETQVFIAKKEVFNVRSIQYIFSSYGIPYYDEIPIKYQINMMKNLNKLIQYKATNINMVDICSLFGFPNIKIFKYYMLKNRKVDEATKEYIFNYDENGNEDVNMDFELKFLKVPLTESPDNYIKDPNNYLDYNTVVDGDRYWSENGSLGDKVRQEIINKEFNIVRSKYLSIDTVTELTKISFELPYFFNMLYDDVPLEEQLKIYVPFISNTTSFRFTDIFILIFALGYLYNGLEDSIMDTTGKVLYILGFDFQADLAALSSYIAEKGYTMEDLGISDFIIPNTSILTYNQLLEIFTKNSKVYDHVVHCLTTADDKQIYDIYKTIYDSLMITRFTNNYFKIPGTDVIAKTYTEFLKFRDQTLYKVLTDINELGMVDTPDGGRELSSNLTERRREIDRYIQAIVVAMEEYIDSDQYKFIYSNLPGETAQYIQRYVMKIINFFKSYKIDILEMNTIYTLDDKLDNLMRPIDKIDHIDVTYFKNEIIHPEEILNILAKMETDDQFKPLDRIYISKLRKLLKTLDDEVKLTDKINIIGKTKFIDKFEVTDTISIRSHLVT